VKGENKCQITLKEKFYCFSWNTVYLELLRRIGKRRKLNE